MQTLLQDLRYGVRFLGRNRLFTIIAVITLGFGFGANSAIFSVVHAVIMRPLPFEDQERLVRVYSTNRSSLIGVSSHRDVQDWQENADSFEGLAMYGGGESTVISGSGPEHVVIADASAGFLELVGVRPIIGRTFLPDDVGHIGVNRVVILGESFWRSRFGGDTQVLDQLITIDDNRSRIIGVVPDKFKTLVGDAQMWFPLTRREERRDSRSLLVIGRLKPGVSVMQADREMQAVTANLARMYPDTNEFMGATVVALKDTIVGGITTIIAVLCITVGLVMLVACANVVNLLLARGAARSEEMAMRSALGASRGRLIRQLLTESCLLAILGAGLGLLLASFAIQVLVAMNPGDIPRLEDVFLGANVIVFTIVLSFVSTIIFGLVPALRISKTDVNGVLKGAGRGVLGRRGGTVRSVLVAAELAVSLVVLIGAGLLLRSFYSLSSITPGFNPKNVLTATVSLPDSRYPNIESRRLLYNQLFNGVNSLFGAEAAGLCTTLPLSGSGISDWRGIVQEGRPFDAQTKTYVQLRRISPGYLKTMQIELVAGRDFTDSDQRATQPVVMISKSIANKLWANQDPVGQLLVFDPKAPLFEIVGVVDDIKRGGLDDESDVAVYVPLTQSTSKYIVIVARSSSDPAKLAAPIRSLVASVDKNLPVANIETMEHFLRATLAKRRFILFIFSTLSAIALALAAIGTYGVISCSVIERTQELGIRMALGASRSSILFLVSGQAARLALGGVVVGLIASFAFTRFLTTLLFRVGPADPIVFTLVPAFLMLVSVVAASLPAIRATSVNPVVALRTE